MSDPMSPNAIFDTFLGEGHGCLFRSAMTTLAMIPASVFTEAIRKIETEEAIGPLMDPTAYIDGRRFDNAQNYKRLFSAARPLRDLLEEIRGTTT